MTRSDSSSGGWLFAALLWTSAILLAAISVVFVLLVVGALNWRVT